MGCGCNKRKNTVQAAPTATQRVQAAKTNGDQQMVDVFNSDGGLVASYSNPVTARSEARRLNGKAVPRSSASAPASR